MGKGAYMFVYNLDTKVRRVNVNGIQCMYDNGSEGSNLNLWKQQDIAGQTSIPYRGWQNPQYVEAIGSGTCALQQSEFELDFSDASSVKIKLQTAAVFANQSSNGNVVCSLSNSFYSAYGIPITDIYKDQASIGVLTLPNPAEVPTQPAYYPKDASNWMNELNSRSGGQFFNQPLYMTSFPAAHDAGISSITTVGIGTAATTQTQTLDINGQLNAGVRYFDLRPFVWDINRNNGANDFFFGHCSNIGSGVIAGAMGQNMVNALQQVKSFIDSHPKEIVILKFSEFHDTVADQNNLRKFPNALQQLMLQTIKQNLGSVMFTANRGEKVTTKTLQTIINSGKRVICLFSSLDENLQDAGSGILVYGDLNSPNSNSNFDVYDSYSGTTNLAVMVADQIDKYKQFLSNVGANANGAMFLFSYTLTLSSTTDNILSTLGRNSILSLAGYAHNYLWPVITSMMRSSPNSQPPNFIYIDRVDSTNAVSAAMYINILRLPQIKIMSWSANTSINQSTSASPAIAAFQDKIYAIFKANDSSNKLLYVTSSDGSNWSANRQINSDATSAGAALAVFQNKLYVVFRANDSSNRLICLNTSDGSNWSNDILIGNEATAASPAVAVFQNRLYVVFKANDSSNRLLYVTSSDGVNWSTNRQINSDATSTGAALAVFQNKLYVVFRANDSSNRLICLNTSDGSNWSNDTLIGNEATAAAPAALASSDQLYVLFKSNDPSNKLLYVTSSDGVNWASSLPVNVQSTNDGPSATIFQNKGYVAFKANDSSNTLYYVRSQIDLSPNSSANGTIAPGKYALKCLGSNYNPEYLYLDGHTGDGTLGLAPATNGIYSGTHWQLDSLGNGAFSLKCLGANFNPNYLYLDGRTGNGTLGLVSANDAAYSGTHWQLDPLGNGAFSLKCLGANFNPNYLYLDGRTGNGTLGLVSANDAAYSGTHWQLEVINN